MKTGSLQPDDRFHPAAEQTSAIVALLDLEPTGEGTSVPLDGPDPALADPARDWPLPLSLIM